MRVMMGKGRNGEGVGRMGGKTGGGEKDWLCV